jgi:hypothetical protein
MEFLSELAQSVLLAIAPIIASALAAWLIGMARAAWAKAKQTVGDEWAWALDEGAKIAVRAAEQLKLAEIIEDKKDYAVATLQAYLDERGLKVDLAVLEAAIEAAVLSEFNRK